MTGVPEVVAVITIVSGRHRHLRRQLEAFAHSTRRPDLHFVVAMDDPGITSVTDGHPVEVIRFASDDPDTLQLADARNAGATAAMTAGASLLVFLDVDCIPGPDMLERYLRSCTATPDLKVLYCGPVTYLPCDQPTFDARELARFTDPHPARPSPGTGQTQLSSELMLFWSLSFAVRATDWLALGGFHPGYRGYGGEDTDFAMSARDNGFRIAWVGGAHAYHQHHPVSNPPVEHLADILRNARVFHRRWGTWPMEGWLRAFADRGLVAYDTAGDEWLRVSDGTSRTR
ncbi:MULTISPECIES: galactosyltransferase-related protein [unclassified Gordonia (in: high G+C Gram-positive bacteria)]|jgi:GT2 family glycosyltransferase|uniref:glycosyltransferase family 2 protein n=1 Tax=unclassified Gordonia (in: high G+C Gram-positive bacteria) TaxID=2657482 RepID=UPI0010F786C4|nr:MULTISPECIES: galactosyltransferase-related protein [unclassified Gordonia (in: high G+C Gram-positive bacteria)]MBN0972406.1 glycosyltransferase [Gordonia sp. BP-119]MBN0982512.1 glycosyltransferase [Gordonia sp. BP-94]